MKKPARLLMTTDAVGGVWTYALELVRALEPSGVAIALATMGPPPNAQQRAEVAACRHVELFTNPLALEWMENPWAEVDAAGEWLLSTAEAFAPDLIHLNGYVHAALPWKRPVLIVAHSCVRSWWRAVHREEAPAAFEEYQSRVKAWLVATSLVVAPTSAMLDAIDEEYGLFVPERVIPNGRHEGTAPAGVKVGVIFSAGRFWDEAKNLALLDSIAPRLPWPIRIAGEGASPNGQTRSARHLQFLGRLSSAGVAAEMGRAAIYAAPSLYEPFGLSILEAGLAGCALVVSDLPSLREVWQEAALYLNPRDPEAWAWTLCSLASNPRKREELGAKALARARYFTPQRMAAEYLASYRGLLRSPQPFTLPEETLVR